MVHMSSSGHYRRPDEPWHVKETRRSRREHGLLAQHLAQLPRPPSQRPPHPHSLRQWQLRRAQRGRRAAGARRAAHRRVRAPSPPAPALGRAQRLLLGRLDARHALRRRLPRAGGSSPTCSPALPRADLTRVRCSRRAGPVRGPSKRPWAGRASTDPATDRLCRWCLSAASRSSAFCLVRPFLAVLLRCSAVCWDC